MKEEFNTEKPEVFSSRVKAGKRTYFFDVKSTRGNDYFITITESKKQTFADGTVTFDKHKIFLYKEDFMKFMDALNDAMDYALDKMPDFDPDQPGSSKEEGPDDQQSQYRQKHNGSFD